MNELFESIRRIAKSNLVDFSNFKLTVIDVLFLIVGLFLLFKGADRFREWFVNRFLARYRIEPGIRQSIGSLTRYGLILIGLLIILPFVGIELTTLGLLTGTLGIGISFGLRAIIEDFFSGLVMLFERPVKAGDRITVNKINGNVLSISSRATTIVNNDNMAIIVPNSVLLNNNVVNWSYRGGKARFSFTLHISITEDPDKIRNLLLKALIREPGVLKRPLPEILLDSFDDGIIVFVLRVWSSKYINKPPVLRNRLNSAISKIFKENKVQVPFPQLELEIAVNNKI